MTSLAIIVVHYRTPQVLQRCLARLRSYAAGAQMIIVDTDLQTDTASWLKATHPQAICIAAPNHSMAHAVNLGLWHALRSGFTTIVHMNADVYIRANTMRDLQKRLEPPHVGMVAPLAYTRHGSLQSQGVLYRRIQAQAKLRGAAAAPWLSGCMQMTTHEVIRKVGGLDSSLRFYNEDIDWCYRIRQQGWRCLLVNSPVTHLGGSSTPSNSPRYKFFHYEGLRGGYRLSQRYRPWLYRRLHRLGLRYWAAYQRRAPHVMVPKTVLAQFEHGSLLESFFAETLSQPNDH